MNCHSNQILSFLLNSMSAITKNFRTFISFKKQSFLKLYSIFYPLEKGGGGALLKGKHLAYVGISPPEKAGLRVMNLLHEGGGDMKIYF